MREKEEEEKNETYLYSSPDKSFTHPVTVNMSSRIPLQRISTNTPDYSSSMMYEAYCHCSYCENQTIFTQNCYQTSQMNYDSMSMSTPSMTIETKKKSTRRSKHIPHHLRPQHIVERRNRRERLRVQDVNQAFYMLQQLLPSDSNVNDVKEQNSSRISKVRTLRKAVDYIEALQQMLDEHN
jgi:achaete-scute complex protein